MEGKKCVLILIGLLMMPVLWASENKLYEAYIAGDMLTWKNMLDKSMMQESRTNERLLMELNYLYGYIAYNIGKENKKEAAVYVARMEKNIAVLEKENYKMSTVLSYKAAMMGYKIALNVLKAPVYGPRSKEYAEKALNLDVNNAFAYMQMAHIQYYTPAIFGGSHTEAIRTYLKAINLMEKDVHTSARNWQYLNALVVLAYVYREEKKYDVAIHYLYRALKVEPEFKWVKNELIPDYLKLLKNKK